MQKKKTKLPPLGYDVDDGEELRAVKAKVPLVKSKKKVYHRPSMSIEFQGSKVAVPMTKTEVGRARPLPSIPMNKAV